MDDGRTYSWSSRSLLARYLMVRASCALGFETCGAELVFLAQAISLPIARPLFSEWAQPCVFLLSSLAPRAETHPALERVFRFFFSL